MADAGMAARRFGVRPRWATPATDSSPRSPSCRRFTIVNAPGRARRSTRRSSTPTLLTASNAYITPMARAPSVRGWMRCRWGWARCTGCIKRPTDGCAWRRLKQEHWRQLCAVLGRPELAAETRFASADGGAEHDHRTGLDPRSRFSRRVRPANGSSLLDSARRAVRNLVADFLPGTVRRSGIHRASGGSPLISRAQIGQARGDMGWASTSPKPREGFGGRRRCAVSTPARFWPNSATRGAEIDDLCAGKVVLDAADPNAGAGIKRERSQAAAPAASGSPQAKE